MRRVKIVLRRWLRRILHLRDTPHAIALGVAVGTFYGLSPLYGLHTILGLVTAALSRANKAATLIMIWVNNPLTTLPILYGQYLLGTLLLPGGVASGSWARLVNFTGALGRISLVHFKASIAECVEKAGGVFLPWLAGSIASSLVLGLLVYPLARRMVVNHRRKRHERQERRRAEHLAAMGREQAQEQP